MNSFRTILALAILCALAGCKKNAPRSDDLAARLQAAMQISSSSDRDAALRAVALDAAGLRTDDIAKRATGGIMASSLRDETASDCALALARAHKMAAAKEMAQMISATSVRDGTLKKLAENGQ